MSDDMLEIVSAEIHKCYCRMYEKRFGKPYWTNGDYSKLDEPTKNYDREMARWHIAQCEKLEKENAELKKRVEDITVNAIRLLTSVCEKHFPKLKNMTFDEFQKSEMSSCCYCRTDELSELRKINSELIKKVNNNDKNSVI